MKGYVLLRNIVERMSCPLCGTPKMAPLFVDWTSNGLIEHHLAGKEAPPSIIIEIEEFSHVFQSLSAALGFNIDHIVTESERKATLGWLGSVVDVIPRFAFRSDLVKRLMWDGMMLFIDHSGQGHQELVGVGARSPVLYSGRNLFYLPAALGDRQATTEALFGDTYTARGVDLGGNNYVMAFTSSEGSTGVEDRLAYSPKGVTEGAVEYDQCPRCGVPRQAGNYIWDLEAGTVTNSLTGLREMLIANWSVDVICDELTGELGEEIPEIIIEAVREFTAERLRRFGVGLSHSGLSEFTGDTAQDMRILLDDLPFRGMGYVRDLSFENDKLRLRVNNPLNEVFLCGKVLGYYEALTEKKGKVDWSTPDGEWTVDIRIEPEASV